MLRVNAFCFAHPLLSHRLQNEPQSSLGCISHCSDRVMDAVFACNGMKDSNAHSRSNSFQRDFGFFCELHPPTDYFGRLDTSESDEGDYEEEILEEESRITGALQIGVIGFRRPSSWICFGGGARPRRPRTWKTKNRRGTDVKARKLVDLIAMLPSSKEEVYGGLDAWCAWELEFPIVAIKKALKILETNRQWKQVIQVTKWMISKGQGKTLNSYLLLLRALDQEGRLEEAETLWEKVLTENEEHTPRIFFTCVTAMFERHNKPKRLLQVFADMEELEIRPDSVTVERVAQTYRSLGLLKRAQRTVDRYPPLTFEYRFIKGKRIKIRINAGGSDADSRGAHESGIENESGSLESDNEDIVDKEDSSNDKDLEIETSERNNDDKYIEYSALINET